MNRRGFLKLLGMAAPVAAVAPKYFFAPVGGWKSDVILNPMDVAIHPQYILTAFYNKRFIENLKAQTVLLKFGTMHPFAVEDLKQDPRAIRYVNYVPVGAMA